MDKTEVIIFAAAMAFLAVRLYQRYIKKGKGSTASDNKRVSGTTFPSSIKDDDYEPYSKK